MDVRLGYDGNKQLYDVLSQTRAEVNVSKLLKVSGRKRAVYPLPP